MAQLFKRISLPVKLIIIGLLPLLFIVFLSIQLEKKQREKIEILDATILRIERSAAITQLVDQLQVERRITFNHIVTGKNEAQLQIERKKTDEAIEHLQENKAVNYENLKKYTFLDELPEIRKQIDQNSIDANDVITYYVNGIFRLTSLGSLSTSNIPFLSPVNQDIISQSLLTNIITHYGVLRMNTYLMLISEENIKESIESLRSTYDIYNSYVIEFKLRASEENIKVLDEILSGELVERTQTYLQNIFSKGSLDKSINADEWWRISGERTDNLRTLQKDILENIFHNVDEIQKKEQNLRTRNQVLLIAISLLVLAIILFTVRSITSTLNEIKRAAQKIAVGATNINLSIPSKDAIGNLALSIQSLDENNKLLSIAAEEIGRGNFEIPIKARSGEDILGNALVKMKKDLQEFTEENERKIWSQTGLSKLNNVIAGEKDIRALTNDSLNVLVHYLKASVGLFYVTSNYETMVFYNGYAIANKAEVKELLPYGETLVGQAAIEKEIVSLNDLPDDYIKIRTASGEASPKHLLIVPLVHNDNVEGVVELASLNMFSEDTIAFLKPASENIAVALQAAKSRMRLQELLNETQSQAEELQAQHTELENLNSELEAQAQKLQASEEELKVQQEELLQTNQELEERSKLLEEKNQLVLERNLEIQKKAEQLALTTKYKSEFLANMSHELRTPLNSILLLSRLLSENNEKNLSPEQVEYAKVIQGSGNGLLSLIDEILDLSKIEAGKMELEYQQVSLKEIVEDMQSLFAPIANEKGIELNFQIDKDAPIAIETDKLRLGQILKNLLSNALKFTTKGSITLNITAANKNAFVAFSVRDTGVGIPKEKQQLVFEAFQQADGSTRRKFGGTGLGLSISRELAKLLGGEIKLVSEPGEGSEFTVYVPQHKLDAGKTIEQPIKKEVPSEVIAEKAQNGDSVEKYRSTIIPENIPDDRNLLKPTDKVLLIVEDDTSFAKALLDLARSKNYKGVVAVRGDEGIELAKQLKPLGILLDVQLPIKSGWEVMNELKSDPATQHIPVHIMSSHMVKKESLMKGAVDFINKPVAFEKMNEVISRIEEALKTKDKKVLIVEENARHAKALAYFLETFQINSEISKNIEDGISALNRKDVNCVILDMGIPDATAYQTLEQLKEKEGFENLPIIIFTGKSLSRNEENRIKQYADSIVIKTAHSYRRILDEVTLFLHLVDEQKEERSTMKGSKLGSLQDVLKDKNILIADDDVRNIFSLTKILETYSMNIFSATDGKEALNLLEENPKIDVVLMDIMMPEMDGYETMQRIRKNPSYRNLPIIAVTAKAMVGDREKCIKAGASDYISKPVDTDQLLSLLRVWLYDKSF